LDLAIIGSGFAGVGRDYGMAERRKKRRKTALALSSRAVSVLRGEWPSAKRLCCADKANNP
jgi:hypothetical protein